jgi:hypothetical protein
VAAHLAVAVPAALCHEAVRAALADERLREAYRRLRPGKEYGGWVTASTPGRWLEISHAALDPSTNTRSHRLGWRVTYDFVALDDGGTRVEVAVEYGWLAAVAAGGTLRAQAENEIAHRLAALHALEAGLLVAAAARDAGEAPTRAALPAAAPTAAAPAARAAAPTSRGGPG